MASPCEVRLQARDEAQARELAQPAIDEVRRIEAKYSRYRVDSVVSRINAGAGTSWVAHDAETGDLLDYAHALFEASDGLFDITSGVLRRAWDFSKGLVPAAADVAGALTLIGWDKVQRRADAVLLPQAGMEIDFGGFGKEYAADRAAACLAERGVRHGFVDLGGDIRLVGPQPDGSAWTVVVRDPRRAGAAVASLPLRSGALATSGDYERFFESGGRRYCHILDPRTGQPVTHWRSVSVHAPVALAAGSFATIAMLKQADALAFLDAAGVAYLAVAADGALYSRDLGGSG